jgi:superfamily II DNA helicase RecQ
MKMKFFWIPALDSSNAEDELNTFLASHRIVHLDKAFTQAEGCLGWSICVQWMPGEGKSALPTPSRSKIDYREVLDEASFRVFSALRTWRKETAAEQAVPVYSVATNEQLAAIAQASPGSIAALEKIAGFGSARVARYGEAVLEICRRASAPPGEELP